MIRRRKKSFSISRRALFVAGMAGLASVAFPRRGMARPAFVPPDEFANRRFSIFYKGDRVGSHTVATAPETGEIRVNTAINIAVKALFFTVYAYTHGSEERWRKGRLVFLKSATVDNDGALYVDGTSTPHGFRVNSKIGPFIASADSLTSNSMWNPLILEQDTLIDAQHGGIIGVSVRRLADERIPILDRQITAARYRFITPYIAGSVWYDDSDRWVRGEFERDGHLIEYRLEA
ncbi:MAG: DUF6134 family protein [Stellaceae bacterium]|jgi:hypothetical protein